MTLTATKTIATELLTLADCLCEKLTSEGAGPTCWCGLWHGEVVSWDYCDECSSTACGMGYVRLANAFPYETFPAPAVSLRCYLPLAYHIEVGALRCFPTMEEGGALPPPAAITEASLLTLADMRAMHNALMCCGLDIAVEAYIPVGPAGNCAGGYWTGYIVLD